MKTGSRISLRRGARRSGTTWALMLMLAGTSARADAASFQVEGTAEVLLPGLVSSASHEVQASVHVGGDLLMFGCADCSPRFGGEVLLVRRRQGAWTGPGRAKPNSRHNESAPSFSPEGGWLYYLSDRTDGFGGTDLYRASYSSVRESFAMPENLGAAINSAGEEGAASAGPDGHYVVFASRGRKGAAGWDLFESRRVNGKMDATRSLATLNTRGDEFDPALLANEAGLVFARSEDGAGGRSALWFAARQGEDFLAPVRLPDAINAPGTSTRAPQQDHHDPDWLLFTRIGADGGSDIYRIRYRIAAQEDSDRASDDR